MKKDLIKSRKGFTLVEILIVATIIILLALAGVGVLNSVGITNKGRDAHRKKDLNRIKIAFEEYFNDLNSYPGLAKVPQLLDRANCGSSTVFSPWINSWPCDPTGEPYYILVEQQDNGNFSDSPRWFKILTNLENKTDEDIPQNWYTDEDYIGVASYTVNDVNYGVSSPNITWYQRIVDPRCTYDEFNHFEDICVVREQGSCKAASGGCSGSNCYAEFQGGGCEQLCKVTCCGDGC